MRRFKRFFPLLAIAFAIALVGCNSVEQVQGPVVITKTESEQAKELQTAYDSLMLTSRKTLVDFRLNPGINPDVTLLDSVFNAEENQGGTTIFYKGVQVWKNSWNYPYMSSTHRERTIVEHGYSADHSLYFLRILNNSILPFINEMDTVMGQGTELSLFKVQAGQWMSFNPDPESPQFTGPLWGIQERGTNEFIIKHGGGSPRVPGPMFYSRMKNGEVERYCLDCSNFH